MTDAFCNRGRDMAVVTCHFNFCGYSRPRQNLTRFLRQMQREGVPVYGVEMVRRGEPFFMPPDPHWQRMETGEEGIMFQKEALLNLAEKLVPERFTKIAWLDADIWFDNPHWYELTSGLLDHFPVVQPFSRAYWTSEQGSVVFGPRPSSASVSSAGLAVAHPGFACAARRELFTRLGGLYPFGANGQGDVLAMMAFLKHEPTREIKGLGDHRSVLHYLDWWDAVSQWTQGRSAATPGGVWHEWHGSRDNRHYTDRHEVIKHMRIPRDLRIGSNGCVEWTETACAEMKAGVAAYFAQRKEDG